MLERIRGFSMLFIAMHSLLLCFHSVAVAQSAKPATEWTSMFNGKNLDDWTAMPANTASDWSVEDGVIIGRGSKLRSYITWKDRDVANFEMKLSYRFPGKGNSGVSIRAVVDETKKRDFKSYHADFGHVGIGKNVLGAWDFHTPGRTEHRCFRGDSLVIARDDKPTITPIKNALQQEELHQGGWNQVRILARNNHFELYINGKLSSEFTEKLPESKRLKSGMIQLQLHDPGMEVQFKDLRIRLLD